MSNPLVDRAVKKGLEWAGKKQPEQTGRAGQNPYAEGSRYYDLWESNPWTEEKMTQQQTVWDRIANALGFRSAYDTAIDQRAQAAAEYDAQIVQLQGEDKYNDPAAQAARMQNAGINPALAGGVEGSQAGEFAQEATPPEITPDENLTRIGGLMNGIAQAITMASGLTEKTMSTLVSRAELTSKNAENALKIDELANMFLLENVVPPNEDNKDWVSMNISQLFQEGGFAEKWADNMHLKGKDKKHFIRTAYANLANNKGKLYENFKNNLISRNEYGKIAGSTYTAKTDNFDDIIKCFKPLNDCYDRFLKADAEGKAKEAENNKVYQENIDPVLKANAENATNKTTEAEADFKLEMKKAFKEVMDNLTARAEGGDKFAWFMTLILPTIYSKFME